MPPFQLAILVPVYNPPVGWCSNLLQQLQSFIQQTGLQHVQLVLINDGSVNHVYENEVDGIAKAHPTALLMNLANNSGKGFALRTATAAVEAPLYLFTDVDFPYSTKSMTDLYLQLTQNTCDIAAGYRNSDYYNRVSGFRKQLSIALRYIIRKRLKLFADDTQCGLKGFNEKGKQLFLQTTTNRYLYDLEWMVKACNNSSVRVQPVPVQLRDGIVLRNLPLRILFQEAGNFLRIFLFKKSIIRTA